jgi:hypothetical protein
MDIESLPADILVRILAAVPQEQRLGSCAVASRRMQAAAVLATLQLQLKDISSQNRADSICAWVRTAWQALQLQPPPPGLG